MKYKFCLQTLLFIVSFIFPFKVEAVNIGVFSYELNEKNLTATITGTTGSHRNGLIIPASVRYGGKEYSVTSIGRFAFSNLYDLLFLFGELVIPNSVTSIGEAAFQGCSGLSGELVIPNSVTSIEDFAFSGCSGFTGELVIPNSVKTIGENAFAYCSGLRILTLGKSVKSIDSQAFKNCNISNITCLSSIPPTLKDDSFSDFTYNNALVFVPENSRNAYISKWTKFKYIINPSSCKKMYSITTPGDLINQISIDEVDDIIEIKISGKINGTDILTMNRLTNLISIDLSEATIVEGGMPYYETDNKRFGTQNNTLGEYWVYNLRKLSHVILPNTLTTLGDRAFYECDCLIDITIPNSLTTIEDAAFSGCSALNKVNIYSLESWCNIDFSGVQSNPMYYAHKLYLNDDLVKDVVIPESISKIKKYAFYTDSSLISVTMSDNLTEIDEGAFYGCSALTEAIIPNSVRKIGSYAFMNAPG